MAAAVPGLHSVRGSGAARPRQHAIGRRRFKRAPLARGWAASVDCRCWVIWSGWLRGCA